MLLMNNNKFFLRKTFKKERSMLSESHVKSSSISIFENLLSLDIWDKNYYHVYLSNENSKEVETDEIINLLFAKNKRVFVPKISSAELIHVEINNITEYSLNNFGIREPISSIQNDPDILEVIIIPLLIFDRNGNRVGYGGGYYDRFLANTGVNVLKIGLSLFDPVDKIQDIEKHDISLDYIITPKQVYDFLN